MHKLRLAFIGGGLNSVVGNTHRIAAELDHRWDLVAGCFSTHEDINRKTAEVWNVPELYSDWQELLHGEIGKIDAVAILTPTPNHYEMARVAMMKGYDVICEKTLTSTAEEADILVRIAQERGRFLTVINNYTGYPMVRELKRMIEDGQLGSIKHIQAEMPQEGFIRYVGEGVMPQPQNWRLSDGVVPTIYLDLGVHLYHIVDFLCGVQPESMQTVHASAGFFPNIVDDVTSVCRFTNNVSGSFWFSKIALGNRNGLRIRLYGDQASAQWYQMDAETITVYDKNGNIRTLDRASPGMQLATQTRYNRFKSGHPAGFIEAFGNYYYDIADSLLEFRESGKMNTRWILSVEQAAAGMHSLEQMAHAVAW